MAKKNSHRGLAVRKVSAERNIKRKTADDDESLWNRKDMGGNGGNPRKFPGIQQGINTLEKVRKKGVKSYRSTRGCTPKKTFGRPIIRGGRLGGEKGGRLFSKKKRTVSTKVKKKVRGNEDTNCRKEGAGALGRRGEKTGGGGEVKKRTNTRTKGVLRLKKNKKLSLASDAENRGKTKGEDAKAKSDGKAKRGRREKKIKRRGGKGRLKEDR